jgi:hypothetical protein
MLMPEWRNCLLDIGYTLLEVKDMDSILSALGRVGRPVTLTPRTQRDADPWSLSGVYGFGSFPWHTDGAISTHPPHFILLRALRISEPTHTELLQPSTQVLASLERTVLRTTDRVGRHRYLPAIIPTDLKEVRLRWDPRTCTPKTGMTISQMEEQDPTASVAWDVNRLLVINNLKLLHRRPAINSYSERTLERIYVWDA